VGSRLRRISGSAAAASRARADAQAPRPSHPTSQPRYGAEPMRIGTRSPPARHRSAASERAPRPARSPPRGPGEEQVLTRVVDGACQRKASGWADHVAQAISRSSTRYARSAQLRGRGGGDENHDELFVRHVGLPSTDGSRPVGRTGRGSRRVERGAERSGCRRATRATATAVATEGVDHARQRSGPACQSAGRPRRAAPPPIRSAAASPTTVRRTRSPSEFSSVAPVSRPVEERTRHRVGRPRRRGARRRRARRRSGRLNVGRRARRTTERARRRAPLEVDEGCARRRRCLPAVATRATPGR